MTSKLRRKRAEEIMERYTRRSVLHRQHPRPRKGDGLRDNQDYWRWLAWHIQWIVTCRRIMNKG